MKKQNLSSHINARLKRKSFPNPQVGGDVIEHSRMPVDVSIDVPPYRLDLLLKLVDTAQSLSKLALQLSDAFGVGHNEYPVRHRRKREVK